LSVGRSPVARCDQPVAALWNGQDVARVLRIVAQVAPDIRDSPMHGIIADDASLPELFEQFLRGDDLARAMRQVHQNIHRKRLQSRDGTVAGYLIQFRPDCPAAEYQFLIIDFNVLWPQNSQITRSRLIAVPLRFRE